MVIDADGPDPVMAGPAAEGPDASHGEGRAARQDAGAAAFDPTLEEDNPFIRRAVAARAGRQERQARFGVAPDPEAAQTGRALIRFVPNRTRSRLRFKLSHGAAVALVAFGLGGGFMASAHFLAPRPAVLAAAVAAGPPPETTASLLHHVEDEVRLLKVSLDAIRSNTEGSRQDEAIHGLKKSIDILKQDLEGVKAGNAGSVAQLGAKIDRLDRDPTPKLAEISARLDRLDRDPGPKLADITARLERIEKQVSADSVTGSIAPAPRAAVASAAPVPLPVPAPPPAPAAPPAQDAKASAKPATVEGWMLRDVYGGVALLQGRGGGLREVAPGQFVPGVGEIRSIERRGRAWVVVTSRGIIEADNGW